ncbi:50S ribosomal protein L22 [candidate division MSBL1 archaeon SCGC-AAA261F19]|uniref:Large ribosomal subunit protein uL22 n=4 Tax=candidate division MSBL1 TaxID=215777 RepID=A0A133VSE4_9EURY|nr:50S ribosomal protein L22 [candidate division MSBL1 archaeon SCGC-AAA261F19]KXB02552.1 50S ribosomal protein L22 [candidate division MSBL1 archaeon SCGC-AAA261D19]KXB04201.1 50S ribosomal protein L22 [candidate division MSBL1 archaeon SCGC-AAA261G05]KXB09360.1 50S ribosomal protein L22 [candidate division MSBL1 archaeon SCGC-AAA833K04]
MPKIGYSAKIEDKECAKAMGKELRISPKDSAEVCRAIKDMNLGKAKEFLELVINKEKPVPYRKHGKKLAHKKGSGYGSGRYPVKAARAILDVLDNAEANASYKGMDSERLKITHASAKKGIVIPGFKPRAFGRATASNRQTTNVEIILEEAI